MLFQFAGDVLPRDGNRLGILAGVLLDRDTEEVAFLVVQHSLLDETLVRLPIGAVISAEGDEIFVEVGPDQFDALPLYIRDRNLAPPPDAANIEQDQVTDPVDVPDVPAVGAATGVESIAFTPIIQETIDLPPNEIPLDGHTEVWATDGHVGNLSGLEVSDQTRRVGAFIVKEGVIFTHEVYVPPDLTASVDLDRIVLNVEKADLEGKDE